MWIGRARWKKHVQSHMDALWNDAATVVQENSKHAQNGLRDWVMELIAERASQVPLCRMLSDLQPCRWKSNCAAPVQPLHDSLLTGVGYLVNGCKHVSMLHVWGGPRSPTCTHNLDAQVVGRAR